MRSKIRLTFAPIGAVRKVCRAYGEALLAPLRVMISGGRLVLVLVFVASSLLAHFLLFSLLFSSFCPIQMVFADDTVRMSEA
jgi:hypothetical protein